MLARRGTARGLFLNRWHYIDHLQSAARLPQRSIPEAAIRRLRQDDHDAAVERVRCQVDRVGLSPSKRRGVSMGASVGDVGGPQS